LARITLYVVKFHREFIAHRREMQKSLRLFPAIRTGRMPCRRDLLRQLINFVLLLPEIPPKKLGHGEIQK
jgi:hypothetical protein